MIEADFLAHIGTARLELGDPVASRAAAAEGVALIRKTQCAWSVHIHGVLARAQLALDEPANDIVETLNEYAAVLERTEFHLFEGELYELRARLAEREGLNADRTAALQCAHDSYTRFGMTAQAEQVRQMLAVTSPPR